MEDPQALDFKEITQTRRVDLIYKYSVLNMSISEISTTTGANYSTVRTIIRDFRLNGGRVNRLLNFVSKKSLLRKKQDV